MKKLIIILFLILLFLKPAYSDDSDMSYLDEATLNLFISSDIDLEFEKESAYLDYVKADVNYLPTNTYRQQILSLTTSPDAKQTDHFIFEWDNPRSSNLDFYIDMDIKTSNSFYQIKHKVDFPIRTEYPPEIYDYTIESEMIDINDDIRELAYNLSAGKDDLYEVAFDLAVWTKQNVDYDLSSAAAKAVAKSSWVLKYKKGVCDEITNLFISMCRSLNIPARFVTGISYTNSPEFENPWGMHGWAEVYFPGYGWVPFDPTYGQLGYLDSGHIKLRDSIDSNQTSTEFEWKGKNVNIYPKPIETEVKVLKKGKALKQSAVDLSLSLFDDEVDIGSYNLIEAGLKNKNDYYVTSHLQLSIPKEIEVIGAKDLSVLLLPNEEKIIYFIVKASDEFKKDLLYTIPVVLTTQQNETIRTEFKVSYAKNNYELDTIETLIQKQTEVKDISNNFIGILCEKNNDSIKVNTSFILNCKIQNRIQKKLENINLCFDKDCTSIDFLPYETKELSHEFVFDSVGVKFILVTAKGQDIYVSNYLNALVLDDPKISLYNLTYPKTVGFDETFSINFTIEKESYSIPKDLTIVFYNNHNYEHFNLGTLDNTVPISLEYGGQIFKFGKNEFRIYINYTDNLKNQYYYEETFYIELEKTTLNQKIKVILTQIYLFVERNVKTAQPIVNGIIIDHVKN